MGSLLITLSSQPWALYRPVLDQFVEVLLRHDAGERLSQAEIDAIVAARGDGDDAPDAVRITPEGVAVIPITGVISKGATGVQQISQPRGTSTGEIQMRVSQALQNPAVVAMVLAIDSPGGQVAGTEETATFLRKAGRTKPLVTFVWDLAASGAYWLGSQAERVFIGPTGKAGSIGVYMVAIDSSELHAREGVFVDVVASGEFKGLGVPGTKITPAQRAELQKSVDETHKVFVRQVASGRNRNVAAIREIGDGRVFMGAEAVAVGLADRVGTLEDAIREARRLASEPRRARAEAGRVVVLDGASAAADIYGGDDELSDEQSAIGNRQSTIPNGVTEMKINCPKCKTVCPVGHKRCNQCGHELSAEATGGGQAAAPVDPNATQNHPVPGAVQLTAAGGASPPPVSVPTAEEQRAAADKLIAQGAAAEQARQLEIRAMGESQGLDPEWVEAQVSGKVSIDEARKDALKELAKNRTPINVQVGEDLNKSTIAKAMVDAICERAGTRVEKPHARANDFRGLRLPHLAREFLDLHGVCTRGRTDDAVCLEVFKIRGEHTPFAAAGGGFSHSSGDFPLILADASNNRLREAFEEADSTWDTPGLIRTRIVDDFKDIKACALGEAADLLEVPEGGEYKESTIGEAREVYKVRTYGRLFSHTRQMLINDDMDAFARIPALHGFAAARLVEVVAWSPITSAELGEDMSDGNAIFDASNHANYTASGSGSPTVARLGVAQKSFRMQTGQSGVRLNLAPSFIIVPAALEVVTKVLIGSSVDPDGSNSNVPNPFRGSYVVVVNPSLDALANGLTSWYMACKFGMVDTIEVAFLRGNEAPFLDQEEGFKIDGVTYKVRMEVGAKCIDWRGLYKTKGAA